jgi:SOS-response transcriptional repressor LexA
MPVTIGRAAFLGSILREQRLDKNLVQLQMAKELRDKGIHQSDLSKLENNYKDIRTFDLPQRLAILRAYQFSETQIRELNTKFKLELEYVLTPDKHVNARPIEGMVRIRNLGTITAGRVGTSYVSDEIDYVEVPKSSILQLDPDECFQLHVTGDSMTCQDVKKTIPPDSIAIFVRVGPHMKPLEGDIVSVWLEHEDRGVLKIWRKNERYSLLESYNHSHKPIVVDEHNTGIIQGILVSHTVAHGRFAKRGRK